VMVFSGGIVTFVNAIRTQFCSDIDGTPSYRDRLADT
jgi:hypothetical protein